jgi:hypothetical protein
MLALACKLRYNPDMHIKFSDTKTGRAGGLARYITQERDHAGESRPGIEVLRGDPALTALVAESLDFRQTHKHAVIAWAPNDQPTPAQIEAVLDDFERVAWAGLEQDRYTWSAVLHRENGGGVHVHIIAANVDLETGKALNIAPPGWKSWTKTVRDYHNELNNWSSPDTDAHPENARLLQPGNLVHADNPKQIITDFLTEQVAQGEIKDRADIVAVLEKTGFEITRQGKNYISVRAEPGAKPIRLKGALYDKNFGVEQLGALENRAAESKNRDRNGARIAELRSRLSSVAEKRAEYHQRRFCRGNQAGGGPAETPAKSGKQAGVALGARASAGGGANRRGELGGLELVQPGAASAQGAGRAEQKNARNTAPAGRENPAFAVRKKPEIVRGGGQKRGDLRRELHDIEGVLNDRTGAAIAGVVGKIERAVQQGNDAFERASGGLSAACAGAGNAAKRTDKTVSDCRKTVGRGVEKVKENRADELTEFKIKINLAEYAGAVGYELDRAESSRNSLVMRRGEDKIIVATDADGHGVYFSVRDDSDNGSIVDFVQRRKGLNLGQVRRELRPWLGRSEDIPAHQRQPRALPASKNRQGVIQSYSKMTVPDGVPYLEERGIAVETLRDPRFCHVIRTDKRGNVVFPHYAATGLAGYELKNKNFTGFARGGEKALWRSANLETASRVIICESAIDCLSYAQVTGDAESAYISCAGAMSQEQRKTLQSVITAALERGADVVSAVDRDEAGDVLHAQLVEMGATHEHRPPQAGDWNDRLQQQQAQARGVEPSM